jgi:predicted trehalose synthase
MPEPFTDTLATVAAGCTALVERLRDIADLLEELPLDAAAEVLIPLEPAMAALEQQAARALERAPAGAH